MRDVHQKYMRADIDIIRADGQLWMRLEGWCDWRFYCPDEAYDFSRFPGKVAASKPLPTAVARFPQPEVFDCCIAEHGEDLYSRDAVGFWIKMWARLICSRRERREFYRLGGSEQQQIDRLLARIAAKDAVRSLFRRQPGVSIHPADIDLVTDNEGRPEPRGHWLQETGYTPALAICQRHHLAIAIAGRCAGHQRLGVDLQPIESPRPDFAAGAFLPTERGLWENLEPSARLERLTRLWCAKHAVLNALGCGVSHGPECVIVKAIAADGEVVTVALSDNLSGKFPALAGMPMAVYTVRYRDCIIASTVCERV
jgi:phosphopantetheinyl transferase